ncbi:cyclic peptide export ABC transporter [Desulfobacterales bacterium HSG2]|nr:cyclic peptide export ABC transporter [Desulfobacterales bacterium HSG2]
MKKTDQSVLFRDFRKNRFQLARPVILRGILVVTLGVSMMATLYNTLGIHQEQSEIRYFVVFTLLLIIYFISYRRFQLFVIRFVQRTVADIRLNIMGHVRKIGLADFEKIGPEKIYLALIYDERFISAISQYTASVLLSIIAVIIIHIYLCCLSLPAGILSFCVYGMACAIYGFNQIRIREMIEQVRTREKVFLESVRDLFEGFKELRLNDKKSDDFFHRGVKKHGELLRELKIQYQNVFMNNYSIAYGLFKSLLMLMVFLTPLFGIVTDNLIFSLFGCLFFMPYSVLIDRVPGIILAAVSLQRLFQLQQTLEKLAQESRVSGQAPVPADFEQLRYENIGFCYEGKDTNLFGVGPLDITINKGEILFITGGNGSGKSTLLKLITGLYPIQSGQVCLNNTEILIRDHRHLFSVIFSDYHLFMRLYGMGEIDPDQAEDFIRMMQLEGKVGLDKNRFTTLELSTGQKKRLAMIAVLLENKPVYVFDEWAADQDPQFRRYFYESLLPSFKARGKAVIAVTHDDRWFHVADRVMRLEYGQIGNS